MSRKKILVVDDEENILKLVTYNLGKEGYSVEGLTSGEAALSKVRSSDKPDLIILDLMLPEIDGFDVCKSLKNNIGTSHIPIIILSAKGEDADVVTGLELGADDYITKPFSPKVLTARVRASLRRQKKKNPSDSSVINIHNLFIHPARHEVRVNNHIVELTATEFDMLCLLCRKPGWVFTRDQIINSIKGNDHAVTDRSVDVQIVGLRKKLGKAGKYIETIRGVGYRLKSPETR